MTPLQEEGQEKTVHPFFQKPLSMSSSDNSLQALHHGAERVKTDQISEPIQSQSVQTRTESETEKTSERGQRKSERKGKPPIAGTSDSSKITNGEKADLLEIDPNEGRRKRRKTISPEAGTEVEIEGPTNITPTKAPKQLRASKRKQTIPTRQNDVDAPILATSTSHGTLFNIEASTPPKNHSIAEPSSRIKPLEDISDTRVFLGSSAGDSTKSFFDENLKPKKVLQFNPKTGTIGSPPKKPVPPKKKGRGKKSAADEKPKSHIIVIGYGRGQTPASETGSKIENILNDIGILTLNPELTLPDVKDTKEIISRKGNGVNVVPWWKTAKKKAPVEEVQEPSKSQPVDQGRRSPSGKPPSPSNIISTFGRPRSNEVRQAPPIFGGFGAAPKTPRFPGATEPAWPWSGMVHVRGERDEEISSSPSTSTMGGVSCKKGAKYQAVGIVKDEDIINSIAAELRIDDAINSIQDLHIDDFAPVSPCIRVPSKHIETGPDLQRRVRRELVSKLSKPVMYEDSSDDEIQKPDTNRSKAHPALNNVYNSIATSLSAFDKAGCENQSWTQKYAPKSAEEILQAGREALLLKEWLQKLTVKSVESGSTESKSTKKSASSKAELLGKRKRRSKKLDGFVVSSGEEDNDMDEITEPEDEDLLGSSGLAKKTVVRSGDMIAKGSKDSKRLANAVVMSGPHGCGKSATVFAVAKELGFEVFEINPNSKRSGKEVMDKVGDMTRNHLVQRSKIDTIPMSTDCDEERLSNTIAEDLKSGRQGTMNSFFKSKVPTKPEPKVNDVKLAVPKPEVSKDTIVPKGPPKQQKQSLILLEEIDILYEEDRGFWQTVMLLIAQSKRPIIMTCNDEAAVPILALSLHAIIRFTAVPTDLAVDYMLLVAANEGHAIRREAVKALYESRGSDLRGSLTELEFWCQFAIGDRKAGMEWFYPRLPLGCDLDEHGEKYRVVSEGTYHTGMGWLCQDTLENQRPYINIEEQTLHESWDGWGIDIGNWQRNLDISTWANKIKDSADDRASKRAALAMYDDFAEAMSATDCFSHYSFGADNQVINDAGHPKLSSKAREDYTLANPLLDVSPQAIHDKTSINISLWMKSRAREVLQIRQHVEHGWEIHRGLDGPTEKQVLNLIRSQSCPDSNIITRRDFSLAFDPIAEAEKAYVWTTGNLEASCFDRTMNLIVLDVAPYVRSIVSYDARLQKDRVRLSNLLSQGGNTKEPKVKKMRTTRAAMSALEGGTRSTTRKEKYFSQDINPYLVLRTGSQSWLDAAISTTAGTDEGSRRSSIQMSDGNMDIESGQDELIN
ncbi:hypothetical protein SBOR_3483 [Sclerotinia borealis F-4128]|uniref:ATPase AAA-type core domain-containing protein n=1 Tax=Sclerotinia borealis (strain F-4128) TaxID=1432307 RepID=W9CHA2_SCLBF|nr:hypothetical protein SBOR_3483 [Sclerotinia borealis F-4128]